MSLGNRVATLAEGVYSAGEHSVVWDGTTQQGDRLPSGVYYYRLLVEGQTVVRPMVIVR
jgi:flagellar hook assembly protein FlgD